MPPNVTELENVGGTLPGVASPVIVNPCLLTASERSCVSAATWRYHGAEWSSVKKFGPALPAAAAMAMPASRADRKASAIGSFHGKRSVPPIEKLITSTPSVIACSVASRIASSGHPLVGKQTWYAMM